LEARRTESSVALVVLADTADSTSLYVPDLGLIVSGDVAYNHCHM
jgi:hypothetical protein